MSSSLFLPYPKNIVTTEDSELLYPLYETEMNGHSYRLRFGEIITQHILIRDSIQDGYYFGTKYHTFKPIVIFLKHDFSKEFTQRTRECYSEK